MKLAIIGSRTISNVDLGKYIPEGVTEIVSGGARGVDTLAAAYARQHGLTLTEFRPDYGLFGRAAPLRRNNLIVNHADAVLAIWDGKSRGTMHAINFARKMGKKVYLVTNCS